MNGQCCRAFIATKAGFDEFSPRHCGCHYNLRSAGFPTQTRIRYGSAPIAARRFSGNTRSANAVRNPPLQVRCGQLPWLTNWPFWMCSRLTLPENIYNFDSVMLFPEAEQC